MDDTAVIQAMLDVGPGEVRLEARAYHVSGLDMTNRHGVTLRGRGRDATTIYGTGPNVIDLTGSNSCKIVGLQIYGKDLLPTWTEADGICDTGILVASGRHQQDTIVLDDIRVAGMWRCAGFYVVGTASSQIYSSQFYSRNYAPAGAFASGNYFKARSSADIECVVPCSDWSLFGCEFHSEQEPTGWAIWLGGTAWMRWFGGNISSCGGVPVSANAVYMDDGRLCNMGDGNTFFGVNFWGEGTPLQANVSGSGVKIN